MIDYGYNQSEICWGNAIIPEADVRRVLQGIKDIGGSRVRMAVQLGTFDDLDHAVNLCVQYGLKPLLCLIDNPQMGYAQNPAAFGTFCKNVAQRYGPSGTNQVSEVELTNEPNSSLNAPGVGDAAAFTAYLKAGYTAVKSVASSMTVICGGTIPAPDTWIPFIGTAVNPVTWYQGIYQAGGGNFMDAVGMHLYFDNSPSPSTSDVQWTYLPGVRAVMDDNGDTSKQIWVTEFGVPFPNKDVPDLVHARDRLKAMVDLLVANTATLKLGPWFIYNYRNCTTNTNDPNSIYGAVNNDFSPKSPQFEYEQTIRGALTADTTPPTVPASPLTITDVRSTSVALSWGPSTDNVAVFSYRVYLNGVKAAEVAATSANPVLTPGTHYAVGVTAVDAAGNESGQLTGSFTSAAPAGLQAFFQYNFTGTGSTLPPTLVQLGLGFSVSSDIALPNTSGSDGSFWTVAPYTLNQQSPDHSSSIIQATASAYPDRAALSLVRMKPDGTQFAGSMITGGGKADACKIFTYSGGVLTVQDACNAAPLQPGEQLVTTAKGNIYTATRVTSDGVSTDVLSWTDINNEYPGAANLRAGIGWWHKRVGSVNYPPPGITGLWKASDLHAVAPSSAGGFAGGFDLWQLAITNEDDWGLVLSAGQWEAAL